MARVPITKYLTGQLPVAILFLLTFQINLFVLGRTCEKVDSCSCRFDDDGSTISLHSLASTDGTPRFTSLSLQDHQNYSYNPCLPFSQFNCKDSTICQQNGTVSVNLADKNSDVNIEFEDDNKTMMITYRNSIVESFLSVECVEHMDQPEFTAFGGHSELPFQVYEFRLRTKCACPGVCPLPGEGSSGLSAGSVLLIIFFVVVFLYLVLGTIYGRVVRNAPGLEMLPNYEFWTSLPGHVKDGCLYIARCACCQPPPKTYDEV